VDENRREEKKSILYVEELMARLARKPTAKKCGNRSLSEHLKELSKLRTEKSGF